MNVTEEKIAKLLEDWREACQAQIDDNMWGKESIQAERDLNNKVMSRYRDFGLKAPQ